MQSVSKNPLVATFQFSFAASLNLGYSQNGAHVFGNGLNFDFYRLHVIYQMLLGKQKYI